MGSPEILTRSFQAKWLPVHPLSPSILSPQLSLLCFDPCLWNLAISTPDICSLPHCLFLPIHKPLRRMLILNFPMHLPTRHFCIQSRIIWITKCAHKSHLIRYHDFVGVENSPLRHLCKKLAWKCAFVILVLRRKA